MPTTLYHAALPSGPTGLSFQLGDTTLFTSCDDERVYLIERSQLVITAPVPAGMAAFLTTTVIEPRLARLGGGR